MKKEKSVPNIKKVVKMDEQGKLISEYKSMKEAAIANKIGYTTMSLILSKKTKKNGYFYNFKKEEKKEGFQRINIVTNHEQIKKEAKAAFVRKPYLGRYSGGFK